ncbi:AMP-binding protein [Saliphagus sp. LR7]|uniref:AMP-binding protein n=1 Tax=Saliphagus sp. LR7 TaxID=2282654 RepID=UPI000DF770C1|nr:AMP-binding protein [Saliphagus sp. LR7]
MTRGYRLPRPDPDADDPWTGFEWNLGESYNIASVALERANAEPDATALRHHPLKGSPTSLTYQALDEAADALAEFLEEQRIERGNRVAVCLPQCPELLITHLGIFKHGAVSVPLSMLLGGDSLSYSIEDSGASLAVVDSQRISDVVEAADVEAHSVKPGEYSATTLGGLDDLTPCKTHITPGKTAPDDPAIILYTSGTTGKPKGVVQGHRYLAGSLPGYQAWFEMFDDATARSARVWTPAEWAWAGALFDVVFPTLAMGGTLVSRERRSGFDPAGALSLIEDEAITHTFMPATALQRIRRDTDPSEYNLGSLDVVMSGGESLPRPLLSWAREELAPSVHETYGQTEANALVGNCSAAYDVRPGSMGKAYPGHDVLVVNEDGREVDTGHIGEISVRLPDPVVFNEYWDTEAATEKKFNDDLFLTGDLAIRDDDGYFWHRGRKDDLIITSGYRVSPLEVERVLQSHSAVGNVVIGSVPDSERGERVKAYLVLGNETTADDTLVETLKDAVRAELGAHKVPREIEFIDEIPETRSGKADRSALFSTEDG